MKAAVELFLHHGMDTIGARILELKAYLVRGLQQRGFEILGPTEGATASGITTCRHPQKDMTELFKKLELAGVSASLRHDREGRDYLRFSPHFYNTEEEVDVALGVLG